MFSEKARKNADACRFCWMCRHLCPVQLVTGKETNTPRAKGLQVSMLERGMPMDMDCARTMYECLLCGACTNDCATGYDPLVYIREARTEANVLGLVPPEVEHVLDLIAGTGNLYGSKECGLPLENIPEEGKILVWLGETARYSRPEVAEALLSILEKAGVKAAVLKDEPQSGNTLGDLMGYIEDVRQAAKHAAKAIARSGAEKVIVLDSYDAAFMRHAFPEWGIALPEIETATSFVAELVRTGRLTPKKDSGIVTYHDGSRLARDLDEHEPAREILRAMGYEIHEMWQNRRLAKCCGTSVMRALFPEIWKGTAENRWQDVKRTDARVLVAACPQSTEALSATVPEGYRYEDLFVLLNAHL